MKRKMQSTLIITVMLVSGLLLPETISGQLKKIMSAKKIDVHTHISSDTPLLREFLDDYNMKAATVCTGGLDTAHLSFQIEGAKTLYKEHPRYYAWYTTFDLSGRDNPGWADRVIKKLKDDFEHGAIGVKIWKDIGMTIRDKNGKYIMVDDPMFSPIFDFIAREGKTLIAHLGEPIQAWMPDHPGSSGKTQNYWGKHPEFSFWNKPDLPSYNDIMAARDNVLKSHPDLRFVGAHLGSLEFDVDEVAKRLETYPNFSVEIGGRIRYLMWQARGRVRAFFMEFQDRIMYGTDLAAGEIKWLDEGTDSGPKTKKLKSEELKTQIERWKYRNDLFIKYLATDEEIPWSDQIVGDIPVDGPAYTVKGLALPIEVLEKIFYTNALKWFPGIEKDFEAR